MALPVLYSPLCASVSAAGVARESSRFTNPFFQLVAPVAIGWVGLIILGKGVNNGRFGLLPQAP